MVEKNTLIIGPGRGNMLIATPELKFLRSGATTFSSDSSVGLGMYQQLRYGGKI